MANYSIFSTFHIHLLICLSCFCMKTKPQILETNQLGNANNSNAATHAIADASNRPTVISTEANRWRGKASAIIMNRWSPLNRYNNIPIQEQQLLEWDAERAKSIQARFRARKNGVENKEDPVKLDTIPGSQIESPSFVVQVKIGKLEDNQLLIFDTGSKLTWIQCASCQPTNCYKQNSTKYFDPIASGSSKIECASESCQTFDDYDKSSCPRVSQSQCGFNVSYADGSSVSGDFFKDKLSLGNQVVSNDYIFGCANKFKDTPGGNSFRGSSGIMGLHNGNPVSIIDQAASKFHNSFSYCLPSGLINKGHLTFGPSLSSKSRFEATIPMIRGGKDAEYIVALVGITVGKTRLDISPTVFSAGALLDTGTVKTWLPKSAYETLQEEFIKQMGYYKYSRVTVPKRPTDVCYDLTKYTTPPKEIRIPKISLHFKAGRNEQTFQISDQGVMGGKWEKRCLYFAPIDDPNDKLSIIGGHAQQTFNFAFDLQKNTIIVGPLGCK